MNKLYLTIALSSLFIALPVLAAPSVNLDIERVSGNRVLILWNNTEVDNCRARSSDGSWLDTVTGSDALSGGVVLNDVEPDAVFDMTCSPSEEPVAQATAPGIPANFTGVAQNRSVRLTWNTPGAGLGEGGVPARIAEYEIEYTDAEDIHLDTERVLTSGSSQVISRLSNNTQYRFRVRAINDAGVTGMFSDAIVLTPRPQAARTRLDTGFVGSSNTRFSAPRGAGFEEGARYVLHFGKHDDSRSNPPIRVAIEGLDIKYECPTQFACGPTAFYTHDISSKPIVITPDASVEPGTYDFTFRIWTEDGEGSLLAEERLDAHLVVTE